MVTCPNLILRLLAKELLRIMEVISWCITMHAIHNATSQQLRHILKNIKWHRRLKTSCIGNWAKPNVYKHAAFPFSMWLTLVFRYTCVSVFWKRPRQHNCKDVLVSLCQKPKLFQTIKKKACLQRTSMWTESLDPLSSERGCSWLPSMMEQCPRVQRDRDRPDCFLVHFEVWGRFTLVRNGRGCLFVRSFVCF